MAGRGVIACASISFLGCAQSAPTYPDPLQAVLAHEAGMSSEREAACLGARTEGMAFRSFFARGGESEFDWRVLAPRIGEAQQAPRVDSALATALAAAIRDVNARSANVVPPVSLEPLPAPLRRTGQPGCAGSLALSAPARSGGFAFVETLSFCGENCASGALFALRNDGDGWRLVAVASTGMT